VPQTRRSGPRHRGRPDNTTTAENTADEPRLPRARALAGLPCRGRRLVLVMVLTCPVCSGSHSHRASDVSDLYAGTVSRNCPVTGLTYVLGPVRRLKQARRTSR
jgi:hypothetical protein